MKHTVTYNHQSQFIELIRDCETYLSISDLSLNFLKGITPTYVESSCVEVINQACVTWEGIDFSKVKYENSESSFAKGILNSYDLLLTMTGRGTLGRCTIFCPENGDITYIADSHISILRVNNTLVLPIIIARYISLSDTQDEIYRNYVTGSTNQLDIVFSKIKNFKIPVPPMALQMKFAEIVRQADKSKFDGFKSQFIEMFGNPISNDRNWDYECINSVAPESPAAHVDDDQVWLLNLDMIESNTGNIIEKVVVPKSEVLSAQPFDEGNVLFSKLRPYLNKVVYPKDKGYATTELVLLRPNQNKLNKIFFTYLLRSNQFVQFANDISSGTKMPRMPLKELREFKCILPPIYLQEKFAAIVRQADKSKYYVQNKLNYICHILTNQIQLRRCS